MKVNDYPNGIPISPSFEALPEVHEDAGRRIMLKKRLVTISFICVAVGIAVCFIAKFLVILIDLITNISFFGIFSLKFHSPAGNHLGWWVAVIPAIGGVIVGLMALYGSKAIRGHGIPEAMEQILINQSKIPPAITFLKPVSSAIAIGTGGPFGAEGPIIATGGALGSTLGQILKVTSNERKIILAAGATAGMAAIFGTPVAAIFLAIELLLFEFSPKSILPVALACITGAAGHHLLFDAGPVFPMPQVAIPTNSGLAVYSFIGLIVGFLATGLTKSVYLIEDAFERLPVHWMWWPAIGGLAVGIIAFFAPHTLGVGYDNIISLLSGKLPFYLVLNLCLLKFLSWSVALGSGTSGGTLAPLMTIGGASGVLLGTLSNRLIPGAGINISMSALVGMSAMFAGASRAYLTSVSFALEATMQSHALLPLLGACTASYLVSFFLMENTIMTEKIARRGIFTPDSYEPDILQKLSVAEVMSADNIVLDSQSAVSETYNWLKAHDNDSRYFLSADESGVYAGIVQRSDIHSGYPGEKLVSDIVAPVHYFLKNTDTLRTAIATMVKHDKDALPVVAAGSGKVIGVIAYHDILSAYRREFEVNETANTQISLKRRRMKMLIRGKKLMRINDVSK